jgi:hypothetical protein
LGQDLRTEDILLGVLRDIGRADFCFFDNLGTRNRPNVYIEAGIAYALGRPMILCEYVGKRLAGLATSSVPSDLANLLVVRYRSYGELSRRVYFSLPAFLRSVR